MGRAEHRNDTVTQNPDSHKQSRKAALIVAIAGCFLGAGGWGERDDCLLSQLATGSSRTPVSRHLSSLLVIRYRLLRASLPFFSSLLLSIKKLRDDKFRVKVPWQRAAGISRHTLPSEGYQRRQCQPLPRRQSPAALVHKCRPSSCVSKISRHLLIMTICCPIGNDSILAEPRSEMKTWTRLTPHCVVHLLPSDVTGFCLVEEYFGCVNFQ